jgi:carboxyl-terminal processing protease
MPIRNSVTIVIAAIFSIVCYHKATHDRYASLLVHAMQVIEDNYVDEVPARTLFENAMTGMVSRLDQYSMYIGPDDYQLFQQAIDQEFVGIGIVVEGPPQIDQLTVFSPVFDSPAHQAGMRAGDVILEIDDASTEGLSLVEAVKRIKGPPGTTVALKIQHIGEQQPVEVTVERALIRTRSVLGDTRTADGEWNYYLHDHPEIGYVRLTSFGEYSVEELSDVLKFAEHDIKSLILDLRGNAGGLLEAAVKASDMFVDQGTIVSIRGRDQRVEATFEADADNTIFDRSIPLVVLVDRFSASASEIVAACLKDNGRAKIVGQRTWGKGTVQNVIVLENGTSALKLTTASYWRPNGKNIHRRADATEEDDWGVSPSQGFEVALDDDEYRRVIEQRRQQDVLRDSGDELPPDDSDEPPVQDRQLQRAVEYLQTQVVSEAA